MRLDAVNLGDVNRMILMVVEVICQCGGSHINLGYTLCTLMRLLCRHLSASCDLLFLEEFDEC